MFKSSLKSILAVAGIVTLFSVQADATPVSWSEAPDTTNCYYWFPANGCAGCPVALSVWNAWMDRVDSNAVITDAGTADTVLGSEAECDNCNSESANSCTDSLEATYTETLTVSVESEISASAGIEASLKSSVGAEEGRERKFTKSCTANPAKCSKIATSLSQNIRTNVQAKVVSQYNCHHDLLAGPSPCASYTNAAGSRTSTASGNKGLMTGNCKFVDKSCPPKACPPCKNP